MMMRGSGTGIGPGGVEDSRVQDAQESHMERKREGVYGGRDGEAGATDYCLTRLGRGAEAWAEARHDWWLIGEGRDGRRAFPFGLVACSGGGSQKVRPRRAMPCIL